MKPFFPVLFHRQALFLDYHYIQLFFCISAFIAGSVDDSFDTCPFRFRNFNFILNVFKATVNAYTLFYMVCLNKFTFNQLENLTQCTMTD